MTASKEQSLLEKARAVKPVTHGNYKWTTEEVLAVHEMRENGCTWRQVYQFVIENTSGAKISSQHSLPAIYSYWRRSGRLAHALEEA